MPLNEHIAKDLEEKILFNCHDEQGRLYNEEELFKFIHSACTRVAEAVREEIKQELQQILTDTANGEENNDFLAAQTMHLGIKRIISILTKPL